MGLIAILATQVACMSNEKVYRFNGKIFVRGRLLHHLQKSRGIERPERIIHPVEKIWVDYLRLIFRQEPELPSQQSMQKLVHRTAHKPVQVPAQDTQFEV